MRLLEHDIGGAVNPSRESNVLKGCRILGFVSKNNRRYLPECLQKACPLYEGKSVYVDHSADVRKFLDKIGKFRDVRYDEVKGLVGDLHYNPKHTAIDTLIGWVETDPSAVGFSHCVVADWREGEDGVVEVTSITEVKSVDLVSDPATTEGIFESMEPLTTQPGSDGYEVAVGKLVSSIMTDTNLSIEDKKKKILGALKLMDDGAVPTETDKPEPTEKPTEEKDKDADSEPDTDKKADESVKRFMKAVDALNEAIEKKLEVFQKVKNPQSSPANPSQNTKKLTLDILMSEMKGK